MDQFLEFAVNNWALFIALIIILVLLARTWVGPGGVKSIPPMQAVSLSNHNNGVFVDVRTDDEYREGHILHSLHAPLGLLDSKMKEISKYKNRPLIVYCRSGSRSSRAGGFLKKQGLNEVYNLAGGVMAWQNANLPLTKDKTPPPNNGGSGSASPSDSASAKKTQDASSADPDPNQSRQMHDSEVVVYTTRRCPFCVRAVNLLHNKGVGFKEIDVGKNPQLRQEMERKAKRKTVPQIFIGDVHVGGCDDMYHLDNNGQLDLLLGLK
ncbi:glutaredoxin 3 [Kaarinaea lacus]